MDIQTTKECTFSTQLIGKLYNSLYRTGQIFTQMQKAVRQIHRRSVYGHKVCVPGLSCRLLESEGLYQESTTMSLLVLKLFLMCRLLVTSRDRTPCHLDI